MHYLIMNSIQVAYLAKYSKVYRKITFSYDMTQLLKE